MYNKGLSYSTINSAKSALDTITCLPPFTTLSDHPKVKKFFKGLYNLRPPKPRLTVVWDVKVVFDYFESLSANSGLSDKILTQKLTILLLLIGGSVLTLYTRSMLIKWYQLQITMLLHLRMYWNIPDLVGRWTHSTIEHILIKKIMFHKLSTGIPWGDLLK